MVDHIHSEYATAKDVNGFGGRLNKVEVSQGEERTKTARNEQDIQLALKLVAKNAETAQKFQVDVVDRFGEVETSIVNSVAPIDKKVSNLKWWIIGGLGALGFALKALPFLVPGG